MTDASTAPYWPLYCEENVWQQCAGAREDDDLQRHVLLVSNPARKVAMWGQRASKDPSLPIAWDYHVVLLRRDPGDGGWQIRDLDARHSEPQPAEQWLSSSFRGQGLIPPELEPRFRLVRAVDYRRHLRSDRRHMRLPDGSPRAPEPPWPRIAGEPFGETDDGGHNLDRFIDTLDPHFLGRCFDLAQLRRWLARERPASVRSCT